MQWIFSLNFWRKVFIKMSAGLASSFHFPFSFHTFYSKLHKKCYLQGTYIFNNYIKFNYLILYMFEMAMAKVHIAILTLTSPTGINLQTRSALLLQKILLFHSLQIWMTKTMFINSDVSYRSWGLMNYRLAKNIGWSSNTEYVKRKIN